MIKFEFYLFYFIGIENGEIYCGFFFFIFVIDKKNLKFILMGKLINYLIRRKGYLDFL